MAEDKKSYGVEKIKLAFDLQVRNEIERLQLGVQRGFEEACRIRDSKIFPINSNKHVSNAASVFQENLAENLRRLVTPEERVKQELMPSRESVDTEQIEENEEKTPKKQSYLEELSKKFPGNTLHPDIHTFLTESELTMPEKQFLLDFLPPIKDERQSLREQDKFLRDLEEKHTRKKMVDVSIVDIDGEFYKTLLKQRRNIDNYQDILNGTTELDNQKMWTDNFIRYKVTEVMKIHFITNLQKAAEKFAKYLLDDCKKNTQCGRYYAVREDLEKKFNTVLRELSKSKNKKQEETASADKKDSGSLEKAKIRHEKLNAVILRLVQAQEQLKQIKERLSALQTPQESETTFFSFADVFTKLETARDTLIPANAELLRRYEKYLYLMEFAKYEKNAISLEEALEFYAKDREALVKHHEPVEAGPYADSMLAALIRKAPWLNGKVYFKDGFIQIGSSGLMRRNSSSVWGSPVSFHKQTASSRSLPLSFSATSSSQLTDTLSLSSPSKNILKASGYNRYRK